MHSLQRHPSNRKHRSMCFPTCQSNKHSKSAGDFDEEAGRRVYEEGGIDMIAQNACIQMTSRWWPTTGLSMKSSIVTIKPKHLLELPVELDSDLRIARQRHLQTAHRHQTIPGEIVHTHPTFPLRLDHRPGTMSTRRFIHGIVTAMYYGGHDFSITNKLSELRSMKQPSNRNLSLHRQRIDIVWVRTYCETKERATSIKLKINISEDGEVRARQRYSMKHMDGDGSLKLPYQTNELEEYDAWNDAFSGILCLCGKLPEAKEGRHGEVWWNLLVNIFPIAEKLSLGMKSPGSTCFKMKQCPRCKEMRIEPVGC